MKKSISEFDVRLAYRKLKSYIYYDNNDLFSKEMIADFETNKDFTEYSKTIFDLTKEISEKISGLHEELGHTEISKREFFSNKINRISYRLLPKYLKRVSENDINHYQNNFPVTDYKIRQCVARIRADIEIHLISVLWLMKIGYKLENNLYKHSFGNRLSLSKANKINNGLSLFKPYFTQYQKWRNDAIDIVEDRLDKGDNSLIISLDISNFFYNATISIDELNLAIGDLEGDLLELHKLFIDINKEYTKKINTLEFYQIDCDKDEFILPIGLPSSYVLANWYLNDLDTKIQENIDPLYYGRYVDDMIFVLNNPQINKNSIINSNDFIEKKLGSVFKLMKTDNEDECFKIEGEKYRFIEINQDKTFLYVIDGDSSSHFIDRIKKKLNENSSEYREVPNENEEFPDYNEELYETIFSGKGKKADKILGFKNASYVLTTYLAKRIYTAINHKAEQNQLERKRILSFFKGYYSIEYYQLWERIIIYFLVHNDSKGFLTFYKNILFDISNINIEEKEFGGVFNPNCQLRLYLLHHLKISIELAFALCPDFNNEELGNSITSLLKEYNIEEYEEEFNYDSNLQIRKYRISNMVQHKYIPQFLLNYTNLSYNSRFSLIESSLPIRLKAKYSNLYAKDNLCNLEINKDLLRYSPRNVKLSETIFYYNYYPLIDSEKKEGNFYNSNKGLLALNNGFKLFYRMNHFVFYSYKPSFAELRKKYTKFRNSIFKSNSVVNESLSDKPVLINELQIFSKRKKLNQCKLAIANTRCNNNHFIESMEGNPVIDSKRYEVFSELLNMSKKEQSNLLGMPECSVPYDLVPLFTKFSIDNNIAFVLGLEHWRVEDHCYNFIVTIIPIRINGINDAIVLYRLKNHYSHEETRLIKGSGSDLKVPVVDMYRYDLINWNNLYFTNFYCYELANIFHRSLFVGAIDLLVASEWNSDINYFSGIVETTAREVHCYFMQVNTSEYGDSRVTRPSKTETKNQVQIKGGLNNTILTEIINISELRKFQYKQYELQKDDKNFKPTPPDFERLKVKKRIDNSFIF